VPRLDGAERRRRTRRAGNHELNLLRGKIKAEEYPLHVVTNWIGNSELVAARHYLQTTNEHYDRAVGKAAQKLSWIV